MKSTLGFANRTTDPMLAPSHHWRSRHP